MTIQPMTTTTIETITPDTARLYLGMRPPHQRTMSMVHVRRLTDIIKDGKFELISNGIGFDTYGMLIDGQHRLQACVYADMPITVVVARGLSPTAYAATDSVKVRTSRDDIQAEGSDNYGPRSAIASVLIRVMDNNNAARAKIVATHTANEVAIRAMLPLYNALRVKKWRTSPSMICAGLVYIVVKGADLDAVVQFGSTVIDGVGLEMNDPVHVLRERLVTGIQDTPYNKATAATSWIVQAWNRAGRPTSLIRTTRAVAESGRKLLKFAIPEVKP